jgi:hypothetical protein
MDKSAFKSNLKKICMAMQKNRMDVLQTAMNEAQQSANEYGPPKDRYDSYRMQLLRKKELFGIQLQKATGEFSALENINTGKEMDKVDIGAVVITTGQKLFISIGLGKVETENEIFYAISPNVPLFNVIKGLKKGGSFIFNGKTSEIVDVF